MQILLWCFKCRVLVRPADAHKGHMNPPTQMQDGAGNVVLPPANAR